MLNVKQLLQAPQRAGKFVLRRWKMSLVILLVASLAFGWYYRQSQAANIPLTTINPSRETIIKTLEVSGFVDAKEKVRLRFIAGGKVTYIGAQEGDYVKKWQTLASIDQATLKKQLEKDLNNYLKERWDWEQTLDDTKDGAISKAEEREVDKSQWDLDNTVLDVEIRDIAINNNVLSAPFAGIITQAPTPVAGVQILSTDYFELINPETLLFRAEIDEADIGLVSASQSAVLTLDAFPDEAVTTSVSFISYTSAETSSGTVFYVEFPIFSPRGLEHFRIGMNGDIAIELDRKENVLSIPIIATRQRDEGVFVDIMSADGSSEERQIETGIENDDLIEVISGLSEDDKVIIPDDGSSEG